MCGQANCCSAKPMLIFTCSGAADVGEIADRAARKMTKNGAGQMFCLAGIGGRVEPIMKKTQSASKILAIDGCELDCVKNCLQHAGFTTFQHVRVTDLGMEKGKSAANEITIDAVIQPALALLA
jgi:uncharacterized metal-binding protein